MMLHDDAGSEARTGAGSADVLDPAALLFEFELRRLNGVVGAEVEPGPTPDSPTTVRVAVAQASGGLRERVLEAARGFTEGPVRVEIVNISGDAVAPVRPQRVRLVSVGESPEGSVEVQLSYGRRRGVGRSQPQRFVGPARATLSALRDLGARIPFRLDAVTRLGSDEEGAVVVALTGDQRRTFRIGVVRGTDDQYCTVRATLNALNRHLEDPLVLVPESEGKGHFDDR